MKDLAKIAKDCRRTVLKMIHEAGTSHIGSNFSCTEILTALYETMKVDRKLSYNRDKFILSAGWKAATLYYFLARKGIIPKKALATYCKPKSDYIGLAEPKVRGVEFAGGSMGMGLSAVVGFALANKLTNNPGRIFVLESDGGMNCGTTWEALLLAGHHKLNNLTLIVDANEFQAMGRTSDILDTSPLDKKLESFGWEVHNINGHSFRQLLRKLGRKSKKPKCLIAHTVKGKGVKRFEGDNLWHYWHIDKQTYAEARKDLR